MHRLKCGKFYSFLSHRKKTNEEKNGKFQIKNALKTTEKNEKKKQNWLLNFLEIKSEIKMVDAFVVSIQILGLHFFLNPFDCHT